MKLLILGAAASLAMAGAAGAATTRAEMTAPITAFVDGLTKGDMKAAAAPYAKEVTIIDEVAPYFWSGPTAFADWGKAVTDDDTKKGVTDDKLTLGKTLRSESDGRHAYVVMSAVFSFSQKGAPMHEAARMTFSLRKGADGWKIAGWAFTGSGPVAGAAAPAATTPAKP